MKRSPMTIRWPDPLYEALERIARERHTTKTELIRMAVVEYYGLKQQS